jgi:ATP phosphoribosyltransferase
LIVHDVENEIEFYFLRPRDIAVYVGSGDLDTGITGRDLLLGSGAPAHEILQLGFAQSTL